MKLTQLKLLLLCALSASALNVFAAHIDITQNTAETGASYDDSDTTTLAALNVTTDGVTYSGTNITLSATNHGFIDNPIGNGAYIINGASLSLIGGGITTTGNFGFGVGITGTSSGTVNNVNIATTGNRGYGVFANTNSSLILTSGGITTSGSYGFGVLLNSRSSGTLDNVNIQTEGFFSEGVRVTGTATLQLTGGSISTSGSYAYGIDLDYASSGTVSGVNIATTGNGGHGVYVSLGSTLTLTDSDISATGSNAYALYLNDGTATVNLNHNTIAGNILTTGALTITGSNGSVLTGAITRYDGTVNLNIGAATSLDQLTGPVDNLTLLNGARLGYNNGLLLNGAAIAVTATSLTLGNGIILDYDGANPLQLSGTLTIADNILVNLSALTEAGDYLVLDWSGASVSGSITDTQFTVTNLDAELQGTFSVANDQLTFNATAVPEPSTWFLMGAGLGALLLAARCRRKVQL
jgi:hypothetical protein